MKFREGMKVRILGKCKSVEGSEFYNIIDAYQGKIVKIYHTMNNIKHKQFNTWTTDGGFWHCECVFHPVQSEVYCI